jgi:putative colanic acid biosynthesis glycosyltransferase
MKIALINSVYKFGSTGNIVYQLSEKIQKEGHLSFVFFGRKKTLVSKNIVFFSNFLSLIKHYLFTRLFDSHGLSGKLSTINLIKRLKEINPDIIHLHNLHGYYLNYPELFKFLNDSNKPVVWTFHDCWNFTGHCVHFENVNCNKWKTHCEKCPIINSYPKSLLFDNSYNNYEIKKSNFLGLKNLTIVSPSNWMNDKVKQSFFMNSKSMVIYNGIDLNVFRKRNIENLKNQSKYSRKFIILGAASVWNNNKGLNIFVKLSNDIPKDFIILLIGKISNKTKLPSNIISINAIRDKSLMAEYYNLADVFLNPTLGDTFPTTNMEAIACGTPVITFNVGGSKEAIGKNTGFVLDKNNYTGIIDSLQQIYSKGKASFSSFCIAHANENFNEDLMKAKYYNIYLNLFK